MNKISLKAIVKKKWLEINFRNKTKFYIWRVEQMEKHNKVLDKKLQHKIRSFQINLEI